MKYKSDLWSLYRYGNLYKVVYYKSGLFPQDSKKNSAQFCCEKKTQSGNSDERFSQSISRAKSAIFELALCNEFEFFVTLTLDAEKRDRNDLKGFRRDFAQFVRNENKKRSEAQKIEYLLIPEQHKNGAWHMHGLFKGLVVGGDLKRNEHKYLDWAAYRKRFGFFSCSRIKSRVACSKYITKYVTKDISCATTLDSGAHLYYASQGLQRRETVFTYCADRCPIADLPHNGGKFGQWDFENDYVKLAWLSEVDKKEDAALFLDGEFGELTFLGLLNGV